MSSKLFRYLSSDILKTNKLKYAKNGQDFPFGYKLDDQAFGKQAELALHFITPEYPYGPEDIRMHSAGKDELCVILDPDERVMGDLRLLIKTEKYTKRKLTSSISANEQRILQTKATQNSEREKELVERIRRAVGRAALVINAADITSTSQDAQTRVTDGFQDLISRTYTQLSLLNGRTYTEQQVAGLANPDPSMIDDPALSTLSVPGDEVLSYVLQRDRLGEQVTVKTIVTHFQAKPYGWDLPSIEVVLAWLVGESKVALNVDSNTLKRSEVAMILRNTQKHSHVVVAPQKDFDPRTVNAFRSFCTDFFDDPTAPKDPLELAHFGMERLHAKLEELRALATASNYPFIVQLNGPISLLEQVVGNRDEWYLTDFTHADDLLDAKGDVIDPIIAFLKGGQRAIYDDAAGLLAQNTSNLNYLTPGSSTEVAQALADPQAFRGNKMTKLKAVTMELRAQIGDALTAKRAEARQAILSRQEGLHESTIYQDASATAQQEGDRLIGGLLTRIDSERQIAVVNEIANTFEETTYSTILDRLDAARQQEPVPPLADGRDQRSCLPKPMKQTVSIKKVRAAGVTGLLETESDVDRYLSALRGALLGTISDGKRIAL